MVISHKMLKSLGIKRKSSDKSTFRHSVICELFVSGQYYVKCVCVQMCTVYAWKANRQIVYHAWHHSFSLPLHDPGIAYYRSYDAYLAQTDYLSHLRRKN